MSFIWTLLLLVEELTVLNRRAVLEAHTFVLVQLINLTEALLASATARIKWASKTNGNLNICPGYQHLPSTSKHPGADQVGSPNPYSVVWLFYYQNSSSEFYCEEYWWGRHEIHRNENKSLPVLPARIEDRQGGFSVQTDDSLFCSYVQDWQFIVTWITPSVDKAQVLQFAEGYFWYFLLFYPQNSCFLINAQKVSFFQIYPFIYWEVR